MADIAQNTLLLVIIALSILLLILGIQAFFILRDLRKTIIKANKMLDNVNSITENVANSASAFSSLATVVKTGAYLVNLLTGNKKTRPNKHLEKESHDVAEPARGNSDMHARNDFAENGYNSKKPQRRFFRGIIKKTKPTSFL